MLAKVRIYCLICKSVILMKLLLVLAICVSEKLKKTFFQKLKKNKVLREL